jgi:hypothetical protein
MWLAGHILVGKGDGDERGAETAMREDLLKLHVETIRQLIPVNALKMKLKP